MNRNSKTIMPDIIQKAYKSVKKYSRQQFSDFCASIYKSGFEDGRNSSPAIDIEQVYAAISDTYGIGPKRLAAIKASIEKAFEGSEEKR